MVGQMLCNELILRINTGMLAVQVPGLSISPTEDLTPELFEKLVGPVLEHGKIHISYGKDGNRLDFLTATLIMEKGRIKEIVPLAVGAP
jgi:hypothetical protein